MLTHILSMFDYSFFILDLHAYFHMIMFVVYYVQDCLFMIVLFLFAHVRLYGVRGRILPRRRSLLLLLFGRQVALDHTVSYYFNMHAYNYIFVVCMCREIYDFYILQKALEFYPSSLQPFYLKCVCVSAQPIACQTGNLGLKRKIKSFMKF